MPFSFDIHADLTFSMERAGPGAGDSQRLSGTITGSGRHLEVRSDDVAAMSAGSSFRQARLIAAALAERGLSVAIAGPDGRVVTVGNVKTGVLTRLLTRSRFVRIDNWRAAAGLRGSVGGGGGSSLLPPPTLLPLAPTFLIRRRHLTTTHDPDGGGQPRLVFAMGETAQAGDPRRVFALKPTGARIGSAEGSDLQLSGIDPVQAEIRRDSNDEYILVARGTDTVSKINGVAIRDEQVLRTGSRIELGDWGMTYTRAEFADHGRPYGGRAGGEFSRQRKQSRPRYKR